MNTFQVCAEYRSYLGLPWWSLVQRWRQTASYLPLVVTGHKTDTAQDLTQDFKKGKAEVFLGERNWINTYTQIVLK